VIVYPGSPNLSMTTRAAAAAAAAAAAVRSVSDSALPRSVPADLPAAPGASQEMTGSAGELNVQLGGALVMVEQCKVVMEGAATAVRKLTDRLSDTALRVSDLATVAAAVSDATGRYDAARAAYADALANHGRVAAQLRNKVGPRRPSPGLPSPSPEPEVRKGVSAPGPAGDTSVTYRFTRPSASASDSQSSKSKPLSGPCTFILPSHDPTCPPRIFPVLQPTSEDVAILAASKEGPRLAVGMLAVTAPDGRSLREQSDGPDNMAARTVSSVVGGLDAFYVPRGVRALKRKQLRELQQPLVYCGLDNAPDVAYGFMYAQVQYILAVQELKRPVFSPVEAIQQVSRYACAAAVGLCQGGVDHMNVLVPMIICIGHLELHGAAFMAAPSFPVAVLTSGLLNLMSKEGAAAAHLHRLKAMQQVKLSRQLVVNAASRGASTSAGSSEVGVCVPRRTAWHRPSFALSTLWPKFGCATTARKVSSDELLHHLTLVFQALYGGPATRFVCFPVCYAQGILVPGASGAGLSALLFPNLEAQEYKIGLPGDLSTAKKYVVAVREAMLAVHEAGVIHGDLYISNIMWRSPSADAVEVKFIDWDTAFFAQDGVPADLAEIWMHKPKWRSYKGPSQPVDERSAVCLLDSFMLDTLGYFCDDDPQLWQIWQRAADDKMDMYELNGVFLDMQWLYVRQKGWAKDTDPDPRAKYGFPAGTYVAAGSSRSGIDPPSQQGSVATREQAAAKRQRTA